jgi:predicted Zn-ribbon and HTH transcriptional regulator
MGTRVRGNGLRDNQYRCQRCGIELTFRPDREARPVRCFDCKVVERDWCGGTAT